MPLPNDDPSLPSLPAPIFADVDAGRGDHLRLNNQKIWQNENYLLTQVNSKEPAITAGTSAQYWRGDKTFQTLDQDAVPDGTTNKAFTATEKTKLSGISTGADVTAAALAPAINAATGNATPNDASKIGFWDSVANALRSLTFTDLKALLKSYFDTLYLPIARVLGLRVAWVHFSAAGGTITTNNSSGITSVARNATGDYTVTMSSARNNIYYGIHIQASPNYGVLLGPTANIHSDNTGNEVAPTTTVFRFYMTCGTTTAFDPKYVSISIYENA